MPAAGIASWLRQGAQAALRWASLRMGERVARHARSATDSLGDEANSANTTLTAATAAKTGRGIRAPILGVWRERAADRARQKLAFVSHLQLPSGISTPATVNAASAARQLPAGDSSRSRAATCNAPIHHRFASSASSCVPAGLARLPNMGLSVRPGKICPAAWVALWPVPQQRRSSGRKGAPGSQRGSITAEDSRQDPREPFAHLQLPAEREPCAMS